MLSELNSLNGELLKISAIKDSNFSKTDVISFSASWNYILYTKHDTISLYKTKKKIHDYL